MENLIQTVETFLAYSEEKLEELAKKNHALKADRSQLEQKTLTKKISRNNQ